MTFVCILKVFLAKCFLKYDDAHELLLLCLFYSVLTTLAKYLLVNGPRGHRIITTIEWPPCKRMDFLTWKRPAIEVMEVLTFERASRLRFT